MDAILISDEEGNFLEVNGAACKFEAAKVPFAALGPIHAEMLA